MKSPFPLESVAGNKFHSRAGSQFAVGTAGLLAEGRYPLRGAIQYCKSTSHEQIQIYVELHLSTIPDAVHRVWRGGCRGAILEVSAYARNGACWAVRGVWAHAPLPLSYT